MAIFIAKENIRIGEAQGFQGIVATNTNRLTQLISRNLGYQILSTIQVELSNIKTKFSFTQVNQYEDIHGVRPFASAPDDLVAEVALKRFWTSFFSGLLNSDLKNGTQGKTGRLSKQFSNDND